MAKVNERLIVEDLRKQGWSINAIARQIPVSKSSISIWCQNITLTDQQRKTLRQKAIEGGHRGRILGSETNKRRKLERIDRHTAEGKKYVAALSQREFILTGAAIYWGEGSKKGQLAFINSDKDMVLFMYKWFRHVLGVEKESFILRIFINDLHRSREDVIKKYWSDLLKIPLSQFRKTIFLKRQSKKRYANHDTYFGLLSIRMRNSTNLKYKILGLIEGLTYCKFERLPT